MITKINDLYLIFIVPSVFQPSESIISCTQQPQIWNRFYGNCHIFNLTYRTECCSHRVVFVDLRKSHFNLQDKEVALCARSQQPVHSFVLCGGIYSVYLATVSAEFDINTFVMIIVN